MLKQNWTYKKFSEVFNLQMWKTPSRDNLSYWGGDNIWVSIADIKGKFIDSTKEHITDIAVSESGIHKVPQGIAIMSFKLTIGRAAITKCDLFTNEAIMSFEPKDANILLPDFVFYYLKGCKWAGANKAVMGQTLNKKTISENIFAFPSIETQSQIVKELDLLQSIIDKQKAQRKELDNLAQAVFYDMFGDPVENEKGWEVKRLRDECSDMKYGTSRPACENGKYPYLRMCNISYEGYLDLNNLKTIDIPEDEVGKCMVKYGDILFNRTNSIELIGKTCMFDLETPMIIAGYIIRVRLSDRLEPKFIAKLFNMPSMKKLLRTMAKGAVNQANINSKELASIIIPIPPKALQQSFAAKIEAIEKQKTAIGKSIEETQKLFDYTMDKYFG